MDMKFDKKSKSVIVVYAVILVVYILAFLLIPFQRVAASWISFVFTILSFVFSLLVCGYAFRATETLVSKIYGFPIFRVGVVYALVQLAFGIVICAVGAFVAVPAWIALLLSVMFLGAAVIGVVVTDNARDLVEEVEANSKVETKNVTYFQINIAGIVDDCENPEVKTELKKLSELFEFSDPVTNEDTKELEDHIRTLLAELKAAVADGSNGDSAALIKKITNALNERNRVCKAGKGN